MASEVEPPFVSAVKKQRVAPLRFAPVAMTSWWESGYTNKEPAPSVPETSSIHHGGDRAPQHAQLQRMLRTAAHFRAREMSACRSGNEGWLQRFWKGLEHPYHRQPGCFAGYTFREFGLDLKYQTAGEVEGAPSPVPAVRNSPRPLPQPISAYVPNRGQA